MRKTFQGLSSYNRFSLAIALECKCFFEFDDFFTSHGFQPVVGIVPLR
jgi:hypothetical protein